MVINLISQSVFTLIFLKRLNKFLLICLIYLPISASALSENSLADSLGLDKSIRVGYLSNGFTYYLKQTSNTDKINLRFYVKVGRYNEKIWSTEQYAHLLEHFGYIEGYLKSYYLPNDATFRKSGNTTFASTASLSTPYWSTVYSNDFKSLGDRLKWFYKISNMDLKDSVILREARCVRQEMFFRGQGFKLTRFINKSIRDGAILFDSEKNPYSNWLTNYDMGGISVASIREFQRRWYRPDRMGLVITGNIQDMQRLEQQIINLYGKIPKVAGEVGKFDRRLFYHSASKRFKTVPRIELNRLTDWNKENSKTSLFYRVKKFDRFLNTKEKWINEQLYMAMYGMIYQRLKEKRITSWNSKKGSVIDIQFPDRDHPYLRLPVIESKPGTERKNLQRVVSILQQLKVNGFTQQEWEERKQMILDNINSKDTSSTAYWVDQLGKHFVYGEILPAQKIAITKEWIESISLKDINSYLQYNFSAEPDDIFITAAAGHPALSYTENQVRGWLKKAIIMPDEHKEIVHINSLTPRNNKNPALMSKNEVGRLNKVGFHKLGLDPDTGLEVLQLENGVKLLLETAKSGENLKDMISISGTSQKGASYFPKADYYSAISASEIIKLSGAGRFDIKSIRSILKKESTPIDEPIQLYIKNNRSTVSTRAKFEELEQHLQLIYLYFSFPRKDSLAFLEWKKLTKEQYFGKIIGGVSPRIDMKNAIAKWLNFRNFSPSNQISTDQFYQKQNIKLEKAMECYQTIFGNASDFTFIISGTYEKEKVLPLLQKYLGNLPSNRKLIRSTKDIVETGIKLQKGPVYHTFYADKLKTGYKLYTVPYSLSYIFPICKNNWKDQIVLNLLMTYLKPKVGKDLRYIKGISIYNGIVEGKYSPEDSLYFLTVFIEALDDELEWIRSECKAMMNNIKEFGISKEEIERVINDPLFINRNTSTPRIKDKIMRYARSLTSQDIRKVARKYLNKNYQYEFAFKEKK